MKTKNMGKITHLVGVDEAGRGPLAGPVSIGVAVVPHDFDWDLIPGVGDSKKVSEKNREAIFLRARELQKEGLINFSVTLMGPEVIDLKGISYAVSAGIFKSFQKLELDPESTSVKLDGLLKAPLEFTDQETIIKGDSKEKVIGLASILAKVTRDAYMIKIANNFPEYDFHIHKGYGTKKHCEAILEHGLSSVHRRSFTKKLVKH